MRRSLVQLAYRRVLFPARRTFYRIFKPKTYGVKVVIRDAQFGRILVVRHCYGDPDIWHIPGGGYRPSRETAEDAARREIREELSVRIAGLSHLGEYRTSACGNRDTAQIFLASVSAPDIRMSPELSEYRWVDRQEILDTLPIYGITRHALSLVED